MRMVWPGPHMRPMAVLGTTIDPSKGPRGDVERISHVSGHTAADDANYAEGSFDDVNVYSGGGSGGSRGGGPKAVLAVDAHQDRPTP